MMKMGTNGAKPWGTTSTSPPAARRTPGAVPIRRAARLFPAARMHWFKDSGRFPHWDIPPDTASLILASTG